MSARLPDKFVHLLMAVVLVWGGIAVNRELKARNGYSAWKKDWHGACKAGVWFAPKERWLRFVSSPSPYEAPLLQNNGECVARRVGDTLWLAQGTVISDAMRLHGAQPHVFEAYVVEDRNPDEPAVQAYGPQYSPCAFRVDGVVSLPSFVPQDCRRVSELMRFGAIPSERTSAPGRRRASG